jgi:hypothetical protein
VDANAFFTMGKGMMTGKVLYRDLFEQKGPLLYLIHGLAYLISNRSFLGVYIFEVFSFSVFLFYWFKAVSLFCDTKYSLLSLPLIAACILNLDGFAHGDSAEELCLPFLIISLYYLLNYIKNVYPRPVPNRWLLINGILAGCVLWIKYSLLGFWFGWMACLFFCMVLKKQYAYAIKSCLIFLSGMLLATLPWILYFGINNSIYEWINTYIIINLTKYPQKNFIISSGISTIKNLQNEFKNNLFFSHLLWIGVLLFFSKKKFIESLLNRIFLLLCLFSLAYSIYANGIGYRYYYLILAPFILFGFIVILEYLRSKFGEIKSTKLVLLLFVLSLLTTLPLTLRFNQNTYMLQWKRGDLVQYKYAAIINKTKNATLLNYGTLDIGLYTTTGISPNIRFFENQNISHSELPIIMDEQNRYIKDKEVDYIVMRIRTSVETKYLKIPYLTENYQLIGSENQVFEGTDFTYLLFKKNS